ncbi:MAG: response regulator [Candidatus Caldatribacteriota bacterium]
MMQQNVDSNINEDFTSFDRHEEEIPRKKKIMVIDDDVDFRLMVSEILVDHGYIVTTAKDGEIGLNQLLQSEDRPDLILVDLMMPVKNGIQFRREQNYLKEIADIPVVFVTGEGIIDGELCIQKPFDHEEFLELIDKYI